MPFRQIKPARKNLCLDDIYMKRLLIIILLLPVYFTVSSVDSKLAAQEVGLKASPFSLKDIQGTTVRLEDFRGHVVIIDFWATWCHECEDVAPELDRIYRKFRDKGLIMLGISCDTGGGRIKDVTSFIKKHNLTYTILMDDGKANKLYKIIGLPVTLILDKNHVIVEKYIGNVSGFESKINNLLEKLYQTGQ